MNTLESAIPNSPPARTDDVWGVMYTHHKIADKVLAQTLATIRAMGLPDERLIISCQYPDNRFPIAATKVFHKPADQFWIPAIYEQMIAGLAAVPLGARVLTLEHDVFYPISYLSVMAEAMKDPYFAYYYAQLMHVDVRAGQREDFFASDSNGTRTLQSCCGGWAMRLLQLAKADLLDYQEGRLKSEGFELGMKGSWARVDGEYAVLDVRQGNNATETGYSAGTFMATESLPYWGKATHLRSRIM